MSFTQKMMSMNLGVRPRVVYQKNDERKDCNMKRKNGMKNIICRTPEQGIDLNAHSPPPAGRTIWMMSTSKNFLPGKIPGSKMPNVYSPRART